MDDVGTQSESVAPTGKLFVSFATVVFSTPRSCSVLMPGWWCAPTRHCSASVAPNRHCSAFVATFVVAIEYSASTDCLCVACDCVL